MRYSVTPVCDCWCATAGVRKQQELRCSGCWCAAAAAELSALGTNHLQATQALTCTAQSTPAPHACRPHTPPPRPA
jgi:hypothetical protein